MENSHPWPHSHHHHGRAKVLIVDDDVINIKVMVGLLRDLYELSVATTGAQALDLAKTFLPDLILLDVVMPDTSGYDICTTLQSSPGTANIPVIFITSQDRIDDELAGLRAGAVDFLRKPINELILKARSSTHITLKKQGDYLRNIALVDGLTGVANRRRLDEYAQTVWNQSSRTQSPVSLLLLDVDHFKKYNDHYGHQRGDDCLITVANTIRSGCHRPLDLAARYGGEEFCCILPDTDHAGVLHIAEDIRKAVEQLQIPHEALGPGGHVTISVGAATMVGSPHFSCETLISAADGQLYAAKRQGRNRVCHGREDAA